MLSIFVENYDTVNKFLEENDEVRTQVGEIFNQDLPCTPPDMREWILEECTKDQATQLIEIWDSITS